MGTHSCCSSAEIIWRHVRCAIGFQKTYISDSVLYNVSKLISPIDGRIDETRPSINPMIDNLPNIVYTHLITKQNSSALVTKLQDIEDIQEPIKTLSSNNSNTKIPERRLLHQNKEDNRAKSNNLILLFAFVFSDVKVSQLVNISVFVGGNNPQPIPHIVLLQVLLCQVFQIPTEQK